MPVSADARELLAAPHIERARGADQAIEQYASIAVRPAGGRVA